MSRRKVKRKVTRRDRKSRIRRAAPPPAPAPAFTRWLEGRIPQVTIGLVALHIVLCIVLFDPKIHMGGDSATYVLLAESLLTSGDGYALSIEPGPPQAHTKYPPAYPALLAPLVLLFGRNFVVLKLLSVVFTAASVFLFCRYAGRRREPTPWFFLALAFAVSPGVIDYSRWMLSEAPFLLFTLLALWQLDRDRDEEGMGRSFWLALLASVISFYVRSIGALLLAAGSLSYLARRRWRKFLVHGVAGACLTIPWLIRNRLAEGAATPYLEEFLLSNVYDPEAGYLGFTGMIARFFENGWLYASRELARALAGSDSSWASSFPVVAFAVLVSCLVLPGLALALRRRPGAPECYFVLICVAIMLFQTTVSDVRYLVPLIPLILIYAMDGAGVLVRATKSLLPPAFPILVTGVLAALALGAQAVRIPANVDMITRYAGGDPYAGYFSGLRRFSEAAEWVKSNTPSDAVVTVRKPRLFFALTDRRSVVYPFSSEPDSVLRAVLDTDFVVVDSYQPTTAVYLIPALEHEPEHFYLAHQTEPPTTWILGVRDASDPPDP